MKAGTLRIADADRMARQLDKAIHVLDTVDYLEEVDPKDRTFRDKQALRDRKKIHLGEVQLTLKALVKGGLSDHEAKDLLECLVGKYKDRKMSGMLKDGEYHTLRREWKERAESGNCPIIRFRKRQNRLLRRKIAADKRAKEAAEKQTESLTDADDTELNPLPATKGKSRSTAAALATPEDESDSETDNNPEKADNGDDDDDEADSKGEPGPSADQVTSRCTASSQPTHAHHPHIGDEELGFDYRNKRLRLRSKGSNSVIEIPTEAYIPAVKHARTSLPVARTFSANSNANTNTIQSNEPLLSEQKGFKLLQAYMEYKDP